MGGLDMIALERQRQCMEEGYSAEHDSKHTPEDLACAGAWYALPHAVREAILDASEDGRLWFIWPEGWVFKPTPEDRVRELAKAGALIAAEIDRINQIRTSGVQLELGTATGRPPHREDSGTDCARGLSSKCPARGE